MLKNSGNMKNSIIEKYESLGWKFTIKKWTDRHKNDDYEDLHAISPSNIKFYVCELKDFNESTLLKREKETNEH